MNNRVTHFEIPAKNPDKVGGFYKDVFNWKVEKWNGPIDYWMVMTGDPKQPGIDGGIYKPDGSPVSGIVNTVQIENIEESIEKIKSAGGELVNDIQEIPEVGKMVYAKDTEGNIFGIMEPAKK